MVVRGRCLSYGEGITYWPVVEVLRQLEAHRNAHAISSVEIGKLCLESKGCGNYKNLVR